MTTTVMIVFYIAGARLSDRRVGCQRNLEAALRQIRKRAYDVAHQVGLVESVSIWLPKGLPHGMALAILKYISIREAMQTNGAHIYIYVEAHSTVQYWKRLRADTVWHPIQAHSVLLFLFRVMQ